MDDDVRSGRRRLIVIASLIGSVAGLVVGVGGSSSAGAAQPVASSSSPGHLERVARVPTHDPDRPQGDHRARSGTWPSRASL